VQIGHDAIIISQVGIAGSTKIGNRVTLAGQVGIISHIEVGDDSIVGSQAGVTENLKPASIVLGSPAIPHNLFLRMAVSLPKVPELIKTIRALEKRIQELEEKASSR
jgi:UDP-3-O-[3-hydroxymyristoyl] glucosamine N-acyltransferase